MLEFVSGDDIGRSLMLYRDLPNQFDYRSVKILTR